MIRTNLPTSKRMREVKSEWNAGEEEEEEEEVVSWSNKERG